jgi:aryl-alcohol dehydrogenase-like predicted oxidoreductase
MSHPLQPIADKLECTQATLALAWVVKNPNVSSAITGASKPEQIFQSVKALELVPKLTDEVMKEIDDVLENKPKPMTRRF